MIIELSVKTGKKTEKIEKTGTNSYLIWIKDIPEKNKANKKIIKLLSAYFDLPKSCVIIKQGHKSPLKLIQLLQGE